MINLNVPQPSTKIDYPLKTFFADVWSYTHGFHRRLLFWYLIFVITSLSTLLQPVIIAKIIDNLSSNSYQNSLYLLLALFFLGVFQLFTRNRTKFQIYRLAERIKLKSRQQWISQVIDFDLKWHEDQSSGKKLSIIQRAADQVRSLVQFVSRGGGLIDMLVGIVAVLIIFIGIDYKYALLALINITAYIFTLTKLNRTLNIKRDQLNQVSDRVVGKNFDFFSNMPLIKSLGIANTVNKILFNKENIVVKKTIKVSKLDFDKWIYINSISQVCYILALLFIVNDIYNQRISIGSFFIYTGYVNKLQDSLNSLADWSNELIDRYLGLHRLRQLLKSGTHTTNCGSHEFPLNFKQITISNLNFAYKNRGQTLTNVNLELYAGKKYGLVGPSGSGKSTIAKLLLKLYLPQSGQILYQNLPISQISTESLRRSIAVAPQDSEIFNLSFKENITISSPRLKFNSQLYDQAIAISGCQSILDKIKNNHHQLLGEKGVKLSGGERQRLGIARAIYKDSPIIIFDESTSSLDSKTESAILTNLEKYLSHKTIIWVAHRLSTLRFTDRIIVFDQGKIVEQGSFNQLIANKSVFHQLWQIQKKTKMNLSQPLAVS